MADFTIKQLEPHDTSELLLKRSELINTCPDYSYITEEDFLACRNSIYVITDTDNVFGIDHNDSIGIIGIKPSTLQEVGGESLAFYCQPDYGVYNIEFLHYSVINPNFKVNMLGEYIDHNKCCEKLLYEAIADKNDGFITYRCHCPTGKTSIMHDSLYNVGFRIQSYNPLDETYLYIRMPKMHLNRIGTDIVTEKDCQDEKNKWGIK